MSGLMAVVAVVKKPVINQNLASLPQPTTPRLRQSRLFFTASGNTNPESIIVTVKDQPVAVTVTPKNQVFQVAGTLPDTLKGNFARISITADGPNQCKGSDGWLVKIIE